MKILGIIGGIAPDSTIEYYRMIIAAYRRQNAAGDYPPLIIKSINLNRLVTLVTGNRLAELAEFILQELQKLAKAGADLALLASNTPHIVFKEVQQASPLPLVSIVQSACDAAESMGLKRVGLFGTKFTMQAPFYPETFAASGITVVAPEADDREYIHTKYMGELINGVFLDDTREGLLAVANRLKASAKIDGLILGGTELPLILRDSPAVGIPFLDTGRIHAEAAVAEMLR
ncbi:MAG: aspartate racemase [Acidobacteriales bacterium]|nr:aspartate racemase [Terriglobales bacterium]